MNQFYAAGIIAAAVKETGAVILLVAIVNWKMAQRLAKRHHPLRHLLRRQQVLSPQLLT
jgi:hypothetical protein